MSTKAPYSNSLRTQKKIRVALLELTADRPVSDVKVIEITKYAGISKGTFYTHYRDIGEVLQDIENESIERLSAHINQMEQNSDLLNDFTPLLTSIFEEMADIADIYRLLMHSTCAWPFLKKMQSLFVNHMMSEYDQVVKFKNQSTARYCFSFIAIGTANLIYDFFNTDESDMPNREQIELVNDFIVGGIKSVIGECGE